MLGCFSMKVAICGSGPLAFEMALKLYQLDAEVCLFAKDRDHLGGQIQKLAERHPEMLMAGAFEDMSSRPGKEISKWEHPPHHFLTVEQYYKNYLAPIIQYCLEHQLVKFGKVLRIQKKFLSPSEELSENKSRLVDLFRVIYKASPGEGDSDAGIDIDEEPIKESQNFLEGMDRSLLHSLKSDFERFDDFDLVIDATGNLGNPLPMGSSNSFALNESQLQENDSIFYGYQGIISNRKLRKEVEQSKGPLHFIIVGTGRTAVETLLAYEDLLTKSLIQVTIITNEEAPFQKLMNQLEHSALAKRLDLLLKNEVESYQYLIEQFEKDILDWKSLQAHMRLKIPRPMEPQANFDIFHGVNIMSIDQFLDREGLFVTLEAPTFRPQRSPISVKTLHLDKIFVCTGYKSHTCLDHDHFLKNEEPGLYFLGLTQDGKTSTLQEGIENIDDIIKKVLTFFSRQDSSKQLPRGPDHSV